MHDWQDDGRIFGELLCPAQKNRGEQGWKYKCSPAWPRVLRLPSRLYHNTVTPLHPYPYTHTSYIMSDQPAETFGFVSRA